MTSKCANAESGTKESHPHSNGAESDAQYQRVGGWEMADVPQGLTLFDARFSKVHYLNPTAAIIFLLCENPTTAEVLTQIIQEEFNLPSSPESEVREMLDRMVGEGILRSVHAT